MSVVSRSQFASIAGTSEAAVGVYIKRGKILLWDDNKKIDTELMLNKIFVKNQRKNNKKRSIILKPTQLIKQETKKEIKKETSFEKKERRKRESESNEIIKWSLRKERANAIKAETDVDLKKLQLEKMMGQLIPIDLMRNIFKINIQNIFMSFENELVNLASIYCDILSGGDRSKLSEIVKLMRQNLSKIIKETNKNAAKEIIGAIDEYSETRSRGERK